MLRKLIPIAALASLALAAPGHAASARCFDASGRPTGEIFRIDEGNLRFVETVIAQGGTCSGVPVGPDRRTAERSYYDGYDRSGDTPVMNKNGYNDTPASAP